MNNILNNDGKKYFGIDIDYFIKNGFFVLLNHFVQIFFNFVLSVFIARYLSKADFGKWQFVMALIGALYIFSLPGMNISIMQAVAKRESEDIRSSIRWRLVGSLVGSVVILLASFYPLFYYKDTTFTITLVAVALIFPFYCSYESIFSYLMAKKKFFKAFELQSVLRFFSTIAAIALILYGFSFVAALLSYLFLISLLQFAFYFLSIRKIIKQEKDVISKYGIQLSLTNILTLVPGYFDKILTPLLLGTEALANYSVAMSVPDFFNGLIKPAINLVFPKMAEFRRDKLKNILLSKLKIIIPFTIIAVVASALLSYLIPFVFGQKYQDVVFMSSLMSLSLVSLLTYPLIISYLNVNRMLKSITIMNAWLGVINSVGTFFLVWFFGLWGVVIVYIIRQSVASLIGIAMEKRD